MMENVLAAWGKVYLPENFVLPVTIENDNAITIAVVAILGIGVFGFWCRKSLERQSVWLVIALSLGGDDLLWNDECGNAGIYFAVSDHSCGGRCRSTGSPAV